MVSHGITFLAALISFILVFFVFIAAVVVAVIIGVNVGKARAKKKAENDVFAGEDEYSDGASDDTPIEI